MCPLEIIRVSVETLTLAYMDASPGVDPLGVAIKEIKARVGELEVRGFKPCGGLIQIEKEGVTGKTRELLFPMYASK